MTRILVNPQELESASGQFKGAASQVQAAGHRCRQALGRLSWSVRERANLDGQVGEAGRQAEALGHQADELASYLVKKARDFAEADSAGARDLGRFSDTVRNWLHGVAGAVSGGLARLVGSQVHLWQRLGGLFSPAVGAAPIITSLPWLRGMAPGLFPPVAQQPGVSSGVAAGGGAGVAEKPAEPTVPPPADFWSKVGGAPVVTEGGEKRFSPEFRQWADKFNTEIAQHWGVRSSDAMGTVGSATLVSTYTLTPEKLETLWGTAQKNHVDPRVLLAILQQEGTGSFDTASSNYSNHGHGPQPDWGKDLDAALDGPILRKLRLFPNAKQSGFPGTWVDYVNWYTPMDNGSGSPGVYAADITWSKGVGTIYTSICNEIGPGGGNPVQEYSAWMGQNGDQFRPHNVDGDFVMKQGIAPGDTRPRLALPASEPKPLYDNVKVSEGFWWFDAPDEFCWYIVKK